MAYERAYMYEIRKCLQATTTKNNTFMHPMALKYGLKDLPCSTEWIDVYQVIRLDSMIATIAVHVPL